MPINSTKTFFWNSYSAGTDHMLLFLTRVYCNEWFNADFTRRLLLQVACKVKGNFLDLNPQDFWCWSRNYLEQNSNGITDSEVWELESRGQNSSKKSPQPTKPQTNNWKLPITKIYSYIYKSANAPCCILTVRFLEAALLLKWILPILTSILSHPTSSFFPIETLNFRALSHKALPSCRIKACCI